MSLGKALLAEEVVAERSASRRAACSALNLLARLQALSALSGRTRPTAVCWPSWTKYLPRNLRALLLSVHKNY